MLRIWGIIQFNEITPGPAPSSKMDFSMNVGMIPVLVNSQEARQLMECAIHNILPNTSFCSVTKKTSEGVKSECIRSHLLLM